MTYCDYIDDDADADGDDNGEANDDDYNGDGYWRGVMMYDDGRWLLIGDGWCMMDYVWWIMYNVDDGVADDDDA